MPYCVGLSIGHRAKHQPPGYRGNYRALSRSNNICPYHQSVAQRYARPKKKEFSMCYNCGCGMPNNDMGNPKNITNKTFEEAAQASEQSAKDAKKNARELLGKVLATKEESN